MDRLERLFKLQPEIDTLVLASWDAAFSSDANFTYFSGCGIDRATLVARKGNKPVLIVNEMNRELAEAEFRGEAVAFKAGKYRKLLSALLNGARRIGVPKSGISASFFETMRKSSGAKISDVSDSLLLIRSIKEEQEIENVRRACAISRKAIKQLEIRAGKTEKQLAGELQAITYSLGAEPAFHPIVLSGRNSRFPHGKGGGTRLRDGDILLVDWGAKWKGYCSDFTRCFFIGKGDREQEKAYEKTQEIFSEVVSFLRPGMHVKEVRKFVSERFSDAGLPKMPHNIGHGIGLDVHEFPSFGKKSEHKLRERNVIAIEPAAYFKGFGVRFENTLLLGKRAMLL